MIKNYILISKKEKAFLIEGIFKGEKSLPFEKKNFIIDNPEKETAQIFLGNKKELTINDLISIFTMIISNKDRIYQIDAKTFTTSNILEEDVIKNFIYIWYQFHGNQFNLKTKKDEVKDSYLLTSKFSKKFDEDVLIAKQMCEVRTLQDSAPNILTINKFVDYIKKLAQSNKNLKLTLLGKKELQKLNMNLILGVNAGSKEDVKVAVIEYKGAPSSKQKISFVGKGIIFDTGGYNLKTPGRYMLDMKYDMSGAAISVLLVDTLSKMNIKKNICCVVPITDNLVDSLGQLPESIYTSMSGKTVEVANTDAEGRLILADALTYAAKELKSTLIIDLATLTGAVLYAIGKKYTGVWATQDKHWSIFENSAKKANELVWRLPLNKMYIEPLTKGTFADTLSCLNVASPDSSVAATWLNQFTMGVDYIHLDIASSADIDSKAQAPMFKTLIEFVKLMK